MSSEFRRPAATATLMLAFFMAVFAWGIVFYGHSFYLNALQQTHGWSASLISTAISVSFLSTIPGTLLSGYLADRFGPGWVLLFGTLAVGASVIVLGRTDSVALAFAAYILMGAGYPALATAGIGAFLSRQFSDRFGMALSLALSGASLGGALMPPLLAWLTTRFDFAVASSVVGACLLITLLPPALFLIFRGGMPGVGGRQQHEAWKTVIGRLLRCSHYWWLSVAGALALGAQVGFLAHQIPILAGDLGTAGAAVAVSVTAVAAAAGRLLVGYLSSHIVLSRLAAACYATQAMGLFVLLATDHPVGLYLGSAVAGFVVGAIVLLSPMLVRSAFGFQHYGRNFAAVSIVLYSGAAAGPWLAGLLKDWSGSYAPSLWLLVSMHGAAIMLFLLSPLRRLK
jgi:MFS family permease